MDLAGAGRFVEQGLATIPGWLDKFDARLFLSVQETQREAAITGDVLEIGVYLGRSAALLGYFVRPDERFVACDLFVMPGKDEGSDPEQRLSALPALRTRLADGSTPEADRLRNSYAVAEGRAAW